MGGMLMMIGLPTVIGEAAPAGAAGAPNAIPANARLAMMGVDSTAAIRALLVIPQIIRQRDPTAIAFASRSRLSPGRTCGAPVGVPDRGARLQVCPSARSGKDGMRGSTGTTR